MPKFRVVIQSDAYGGPQVWTIEATDQEVAFEMACASSTNFDAITAQTCGVPFDATTHRTSFKLLKTVEYEGEPPDIDLDDFV